jgi:hypothetical protein
MQSAQFTAQSRKGTLKPMPPSHMWSGPEDLPTNPEEALKSRFVIEGQTRRRIKTIINDVIW